MCNEIQSRDWLYNIYRCRNQRLKCWDHKWKWSECETQSHFNVIELTTIKFAISYFLPLKLDMKHVRIMTDNSTAISYINKQGGVKSITCNDIAKEIWEFCIQKRVHLWAGHIPGIHNVTADLALLEFKDNHEWIFYPAIFTE